MVTDNPIFQPFALSGVLLLFKVGFITFALLYFIFTLVVIRQVNSMTNTIVTEGGPILKALAILYAGLALGVIVLFIGFL